MSMKDAAVLANCIFNMNDDSTESIRAAFEGYYTQCFPEAELQFKITAFMSKIMSGQKWTERALRYAVINCIPYWLLQKLKEKDMAYRPQVNWLPLVENRGIDQVLPQVGREKAKKALAV